MELSGIFTEAEKDIRVTVLPYRDTPMYEELKRHVADKHQLTVTQVNAILAEMVRALEGNSGEKS